MVRKRMGWLVGGLFVLLVGGIPLPAAAQDERCFPETGFCISGRIRSFWEQNGGLPVFGFPIAAEQEEQVEGKPVRLQWFERNRLELHPENAAPYDVLLGRLGADRLAQLGRDWQTFPKSAARDGCAFYGQTSHAVCGAFLEAFRASGLDLGQPGVTEAESLALFGLPLSEAADEVNPSNGQTYLTQHFERARFEFHPENQPPYTVLFGLLGREVRENTAPPAPKPLPAPSFNNCQEDPLFSQAPNYPVQIVGVNKAAETVTLKNVGPDPIDLSGWRMCSIKGNQQHPIGGVLQPGQQTTFPGPAAQIWSNSERDDAALYNPAGQLVAYRLDG